MPSLHNCSQLQAFESRLYHVVRYRRQMARTVDKRIEREAAHNVNKQPGTYVMDRRKTRLHVYNLQGQLHIERVSNLSTNISASVLDRAAGCVQALNQMSGSLLFNISTSATVDKTSSLLQPVCVRFTPVDCL